MVQSRIMSSEIVKAIDTKISELQSQIAALQSAKSALGGRAGSLGARGGGGSRKRRKLTAAERAAISRRMKAAWARRKAQK
jgi:hypothetical protein